MKTSFDDLLTCRAEGYPVIHHNDAKMDPSKRYRVTVSCPREWPKGRLKPGTPLGLAYLYDGTYSYESLWEVFTGEGDQIKAFCDFKSCPLPDPSEARFSDMATLFAILDGYGVLDIP